MALGGGGAVRRRGHMGLVPLLTLQGLPLTPRCEGLSLTAQCEHLSQTTPQAWSDGSQLQAEKTM